LVKASRPRNPRSVVFGTAHRAARNCPDESGREKDDDHNAEKHTKRRSSGFNGSFQRNPTHRETSAATVQRSEVTKVAQRT
jgi:hypothetical protein